MHLILLYRHYIATFRIHTYCIAWYDKTSFKIYQFLKTFTDSFRVSWQRWLDAPLSFNCYVRTCIYVLFRSILLFPSGWKWHNNNRQWKYGYKPSRNVYTRSLCIPEPNLRPIHLLPSKTEQLFRTRTLTFVFRIVTILHYWRVFYSVVNNRINLPKKSLNYF